MQRAKVPRELLIDFAWESLFPPPPSQTPASLGPWSTIGLTWRWPALDISWRICSPLGGDPCTAFSSDCLVAAILISRIEAPRP